MPLQPPCTAAIAQLGERQTEDLKVPGSIPGLGMRTEAMRRRGALSSHGLADAREQQVDGGEGGVCGEENKGRDNKHRIITGLCAA